MLTYIDKARKAGYAVMILRPNTNSATITGNANSDSGAEKKVLIKGSESPEIHALYVWENFICKCDNIKMVSLLGINTTNTAATIATTTVSTNTATIATSTTTVSTTIIITNTNAKLFVRIR